MDRKEKVLLFLKEQAKAAYLPSEIAAFLGAQDGMDELQTILDELLSEGQLVKRGRGRYEAADKADAAEGIYRRNAKGFGFVTCSGGDIYISEKNRAGALDGDTVQVRGVKSRRNREGVIVKVLKRGRETVTAVYRKGYAVPRDKALDIKIKIDNPHTEFEGCRVAVKITDYKKMHGEVLVSLGSANDPDSAVAAILYEYGVERDFPSGVEKEAKTLSTLKPNTSSRRDLRRLLTVTVDPDEARDLDDAVSLVMDADGNYVLYVHIADVSEYVKGGSEVDKEAFSRGTSCYYPDMVCPMIPSVLSNGVCSLNPHEDRLAVTTKMTIDPEGRLKKYEISESLISSDFRMTYDGVTDLLENNKPAHRKKYAEVSDMLFSMRDLALILRRNRFENGSIDFNIPEAKVVMENGIVKDIVLEDNSISHQIIEEFMLICNKTVAEHASRAQLPFVYRVHEAPSDEKMDHFKAFAALFGCRAGGKMSGQRIMQILEKFKDTPQERAVNTVLLRSMAKARYDEENTGHFGIGAAYYCHFTSPIRRYPDLLCHRIIKASFSGDCAKFASLVSEAAIKSSEREIAAAQSERDVVRLKMCEYMSEHIGEEYDAVISSVTGFGFFAELENTIEGLVRAEDIKTDYFVFDEKTLSLVGKRTKKTFSIGDKVRVTVAGVDTENAYIDFFPTDFGEVRRKERKKINGRKRRKNNRRKQKGVSRLLRTR